MSTLTMPVRILGALLLTLLLGCGSGEEKTELPLRPVHTMTMEEFKSGKIRVYVGATESSQVVRVSFKVSGTVASMPVAVGDSLKKGDLIARLDTAPFELRVQQASASLAQAKAAERNADANYNRVRDLYENGNASRTELDSGRANAESARAQVSAAAKSLELAELDVEYAVLRASERCSIASVDIEVNENVSPNTPIASINCGDAVNVNVDVPASLVNQLSLNTPVSVAIPDANLSEVAGTITEIGVASTGTGSTYPVTVRLVEATNLRDGLSSEVTFTVSADSTSFVIPTSATLHRSNQVYVYVLEDSGKPGTAVVRERAVELGELTTAGVEVMSGLQSGDKVVTAGVGVIRSGLEVKAPQ